jgi:hypothetical protein
MIKGLQPVEPSFHRLNTEHAMARESTKESQLVQHDCSSTGRLVFLAIWLTPSNPTRPQSEMDSEQAGISSLTYQMLGAYHAHLPQTY